MVFDRFFKTFLGILYGPRFLFELRSLASLTLSIFIIHFSNKNWTGFYVPEYKKQIDGRKNYWQKVLNVSSMEVLFVIECPFNLNLKGFYNIKCQMSWF